jgi:hypothetical protein
MQDPTGMFNPADFPNDVAMPLVLCQTNGGPFDDQAFMAGFDCGALHSDLKLSKFMGALPASRIVKKVVLKQLDLMCMLHEFVPTAYEISGFDHICWVVFDRATTAEDLPQ